MIKFFRHIRKSLIQKNQMGKYFKYAIGEILLVVVGILIALQINTWNENRINQKKASKYLNALKADIIKDTASVSYRINHEIERKKEYDNYFTFIKNGNVSIEQLKDTLNRFMTVSGGNDFTTTTYDELIASGSFEIVPKEKRTLIISYFAIAENYKQIMDSYDESKRKEEHESRKYLDLEGDQYDLFKALNYTPKQEHIVQGLKHLHNTVKLEYFKSSFLKRIGDMYLKDARDILIKLDEND